MRLLVRGAELKRRRLALLLTQEQLSERTGLSVASIRAFENGTSNGARAGTIRDLAVGLKCRAEDLFDVVGAAS